MSDIAGLVDRIHVEIHDHEQLLQGAIAECESVQGAIAEHESALEVLRRMETDATTLLDGAPTPAPVSDSAPAPAADPGPATPAAPARAATAAKPTKVARTGGTRELGRERRRLILELLADADQPLGSRELEGQLAAVQVVVDGALRRLVADGIVEITPDSRPRTYQLVATDPSPSAPAAAAAAPDASDQYTGRSLGELQAMADARGIATKGLKAAELRDALRAGAGTGAETSAVRRSAPTSGDPEDIERQLRIEREVRDYFEHETEPVRLRDIAKDLCRNQQDILIAMKALGCERTDEGLYRAVAVASNGTAPS